MNNNSSNRSASPPPPPPSSSPSPSPGNLYDALPKDDGLSDIERLDRYIPDGSPQLRLYCVNKLPDIIQQEAKEFDARVKQAVQLTIKDPKPLIRKTLASVLGKVKGSAPFLIKLLGDFEKDVAEAASESLVEIAKSDESVIKIVANILEAPKDEEIPEIAISAFAKFGKLGKELAMKTVVPQLIKLAANSAFRVRRAVAQSIGPLAKTAHKEFLPVFIKLTGDSVFIVRKGCLESVAQLTAASSRDTQRDVLIPLMERMSQDKSRWVRDLFYQVLGPFIYSCEADLITSGFLKMYTGIPKLQKNVVDVEVVYYCAYNFPAVVLKLGKDRWGELRNLHAELSNHLKFKVRTSLAYSLHEVGAIVGHEISDRDLIPAFDAFIKDLEEVKIGVITSFFSFLKCISPEKRVEYVEVLRDIQRDSDQNWRYRELLAKQIGTSTDLFLLDHLATEVVPVLIELVSDRISAVRQAAVLQVGKFINALENHELYQEFLQELRYLGLSNTFLERQLYLRICNAIVNVISEQRFKEDFLPLMVSLCKDNVCNVRIILSQFLAQTLTQIESFRFDLKIRSALYILQKDSCKEIQQNLKQIPHIEELLSGMNEDIINSSLSCTL